MQQPAYGPDNDGDTGVSAELLETCRHKRGPSSHAETLSRCAVQAESASRGSPGEGGGKGKDEGTVVRVLTCSGLLSSTLLLRCSV